MSNNYTSRTELINLANEFTEELVTLFLAQGKSISKKNLDEINDWFRLYFRETNDWNKTRVLTTQEVRRILDLTSADIFPVPQKRKVAENDKTLEELLAIGLGELDLSKSQVKSHSTSDLSASQRSKLSADEITERLDALRKPQNNENISFTIGHKKTNKINTPYHDPFWKPIGHIDNIHLVKEVSLYSNYTAEMTTYTVNVRDSRQQRSFADAVFENCHGTCLISGFTDRRVLEAAHIKEIKNNGNMHFTNGLMLRADLHRAFDKNLIGINPVELTIHTKLHEYKNYEGVKLKPTKTPMKFDYLNDRWNRFNEL